jgi:pyrrolidone-carboxylate peptidase
MGVMSVDGIRKALVSARADGKVDLGEVDRIMLAARDGGGLDAGERTEVLQAADTFDDAGKQRVLSYLATMDQKNAWVNVETQGSLATITGRYAKMTVGVPGLAGREGLFDNCLGIKGTAKADGQLKLTVEGTPLSIAVKKGDTAAQVLANVQAALPKSITGVALGGDVSPYDPALFSGKAASKTDTAAHLMLYKPDALGLKPGEKPLRVVVTGYGQFMGITDNPSANMAQKLAEQGVPGAIVEYRRLDVTTQGVDAFIAEMHRNPPDVILSMGVTGGQSQVEELPENHLGAANDGNDKPMPDRQVRPGGAATLKTDLPVEAIDWALKPFGDARQVFTSKSDPNYQPDRSAYLCNYLGYNLASEFGKTDATTAGFMHVTSNTPVDQMHAALQAITARQLDWRRTQVATPTV